jgi:hypothetical protein
MCVSDEVAELELESADRARDPSFEAEKLALAAALVKLLSTLGKCSSGTMLENMVSQLSTLASLPPAADDMLRWRSSGPSTTPCVLSTVGDQDSRSEEGPGPSMVVCRPIRRRGGKSATVPGACVGTVSSRSCSRPLEDTGCSRLGLGCDLRSSEVMSMFIFSG